MKVVDISIYRKQKEIRILEERVSLLVYTKHKGAISHIKTCFKEWLNKTK